MSSVTNVGIKLTLDGAAQAEAGLRRVQGGMAALGNTAESVRGALQQLAGAFAGAVSVRAFVQAADAVTQLQNQLRLATGSTQAATAAYQQLFEIAQRSRVSFTELGGTFASIARASESLGLSQQQLLRLTETIGNAIAVGGQSAQASQAALVQLSQGLASGVLRGEELNSILEQTPRLARALADGLGVSTGALRKLGEEGELTAERVIGALQSQASVLANEVAGSVVTVGQAFTQLQNSATVLVGEIDRVSGSSATLAGVAQSASESLDNIARAFRDTQSAGQQVNVFADAIAVVFETVAVLGVNVAYVIKQIGTEIGGLAAQAEQYVRGGQVVGILFDVLTKGYSEEWNAIKAIRAEMVKDAAAARREVDALSERILNQRRLAEQARQSLQGVDTRAEDARLARYAEQAEGVRKVGAAAGEAKKKVKELGDEFASQRDAAKAWADAYQDFTRIAAQANAESLGLTKAQARLVEFLSSPAYANASEPMRQLALEQAYAAVTAEQNAAAQTQQAKAIEAAAKAEAERIEALERNATGAEEQLQRLLDEERALVIAAERNLTLAQAIEEVAIARLREQQAALMAEGDRDAEVLAIQREIDARKQLAEAIGRKEARDAATESAKEAAREWERTAENIERSLTDALLRGFESGKDFARNLRDTVVNMFKTLVLRPVIQAVIAPMAGGLTSLLGLPSTANAATGGSGAFGLASGLKSVYDSIVGGFTSLGNSVAFAAQDIGAWLVNNTSGILNQFGGSLMSNSGLLGTGASYLGGAGAGLALGNLISGGYSAIGKSGNTANVAGTAIGAFFGGPIGAAIGGAIGGLANRLFGRKLKDQGIEGTFGDDGFTGNSYQFYKGGLFRSDKTKRSALDLKLDQALDQQFMALKGTVASMAQALGVGTESIDNFTKKVKISFKGLNEEQVQQKLTEVFTGIGDELASGVSRALKNGGLDDLPAWARRFAAALPEEASLQQLTEVVQQIAAFPNQALQLFGLSRDALVQQFAEGLMSGDAEAAGMAVADTVVASIERGVITNGAAAIFDIVNAGIITPILDALIQGQAVSEALSDAAIEAAVQKVNAVASALGQLLNDPSFKSALDRLRETLSGALAGAAESISYTPQFQVTRLEEQRRAAEEAARAQEAYNRALAEAQSRLSAAESALQAARDRVDGVRDRATSEYLAAQDQVASAQERVNAVLRQQYEAALQTAEALREMGRSLREFVLGAAGDAQQVFADVLSRAMAGDRNAMQALPNAARAAAESAGQNASTSTDARLAQAAIYAQVLQVARAAENTPLPVNPGVPAVDELAQAQAELAAAQANLAEALRVANAINAPLTQSVTNLIAEYQAAMAEMAQAQAEYAAAQAVLASIERNTATTGTNTANTVFNTAPLTRIEENTRSIRNGLVFDPNDPIRSVFDAINLQTAANVQASVRVEAQVANVAGLTRNVWLEAAGILGRLDTVINGTRSFLIRGATTAFAKGGVFTNQVVGSPTTFDMGLMGEAGPEAIMPLKRLGDGRLGVVAELPPIDFSRFGRADNSEVVAEVRALRSENAAQARALVQLQQRMTKIIERWDGTGLPEERVLA